MSPADTGPLTWGDGLAAIRAFLRSLPPEMRNPLLWLTLLREANAGTRCHPGDVKHPAAKDVANEVKQ